LTEKRKERELEAAMNPEDRKRLQQEREAARAHENQRTAHYSKLGKVYLSRATSMSLIPVLYRQEPPPNPQRKPKTDTTVSALRRLSTKVLSLLQPKSPTVSLGAVDE
jgi:hypothetical protein